MNARNAMLFLVTAIVAIAGCIGQSNATSQAQSCTASGGAVETSSCCLSASDFPNTCLIGACGCSLENSHNVNTCVCPEGKCFDGTSCV